MEFRKWPKTTRLESPIDITEKLNGSNTAIGIEKAEWNTAGRYVVVDESFYNVVVQSRNRFITVDNDHQGFAKWVNDNLHALVRILGEGYHFGEWMTQANINKFFLFNRTRWEKEFRVAAVEEDLDSLSAVPLLYRGDYYEGVVREVAKDLLVNGSRVKGVQHPEGVVVYWHHDNTMKKFHLKGMKDVG